MNVVRQKIFHDNSNNIATDDLSVKNRPLGWKSINHPQDTFEHSQERSAHVRYRHGSNTPIMGLI